MALGLYLVNATLPQSWRFSTRERERVDRRARPAGSWRCERVQLSAVCCVGQASRTFRKLIKYGILNTSDGRPWPKQLEPV